MAAPSPKGDPIDHELGVFLTVPPLKPWDQGPGLYPFFGLLVGTLPRLVDEVDLFDNMNGGLDVVLHRVETNMLDQKCLDHGLLYTGPGCSGIPAFRGQTGLAAFGTHPTSDMKLPPERLGIQDREGLPQQTMLAADDLGGAHKGS